MHLHPFNFHSPSRGALLSTRRGLCIFRCGTRCISMRAAAEQWWAAEAEAEAEFTRLEESLIDTENTVTEKTIVEAARYRMAKGKRINDEVFN